MSYTDWRTYAVCTGCEAKHYAPFGKLFHVSFECCPRCGEPKYGWPIQIMRWVNDGQMFRPATWGSGHWETKAETP